MSSLLGLYDLCIRKRVIRRGRKAYAPTGINGLKTMLPNWGLSEALELVCVP